MPTDHGQRPIAVDPYALREPRPVDENLEEFADNLLHYRGRLVVFLGAGASIGALGGPELAPLPSALALRDEIWQRFLVPKGSSAFDVAQIGMMSLDQATAFAETRVGRQAVAEFLASRFLTRRPLWQHAVLPFLNPRALFSTNYDLLVEHGWALHARVADIPPLVSIFADGQRLAPNRTPLFKPHGSADRALDPIGAGGPVITTTDYFEILARKHALLNQWLTAVEGACVLLVGYSMADMDIGGHLYTRRQTDSSVHWYSVFPRSDSTVRKYWSERLRIRPIDRRFVEFMHDLDALTNFIPDSWKYGRLAELRAEGMVQ